MTFEDDLLALERRVLTDAAGDFLRAVALLRRMLATDTPGIPAALERLAIPALEQAVQAGIGEAYLMGGQRAIDAATDAVHIGDNAVSDAQMRLDAGPHQQLTDPLAGLDTFLIDAKARSVALLRSGAPVDTALAPVFHAATTARLRVETQINASSNEAALTVGDATGSPMVWEAERDACVYCLALAGHVIETPGDPFPKADLYAPVPASQWSVSRPPLHGHCLPGDATVTPGSRVTGASSRIYEGEMVRVRTLSGKELSATPNHPVLTDRGWMPLGILRPGDRVLSRADGERPLRSYSDHEHVPAMICEIAEATLGSSEVVTTEMPMSAVDFHGDGTEGEVAHIGSDLHLPPEHLPLSDQHRRELLLMRAVDRATSGTSGSALDSLRIGMLASTDGLMRGSSETSSLFRGRLRHALEHRAGSVAWFDAALEQTGADGSPADPEAVGDALLALAGEVIADELVSVERYAFHGPVFNLETETGWYTGNGIIVHNCRCQIAVLVDPSYADALRREAQRSVLRGFSLASESQAVRVRAAQRLLERDPIAPKSVKAYAARAVREGRFPTRQVPGGDPRLDIG